MHQQAASGKQKLGQESKFVLSVLVVDQILVEDTLSQNLPRSAAEKMASVSISSSLRVAFFGLRSNLLGCQNAQAG